MRSTGSVLLLLSATAFGAMAVFGTLAYDEGATVGTLLTARFVLAAAAWWAVLLATRSGAAELRSLGRRDVLVALGLGACGYAAQAGGFFAALSRMDASLLSLVVYTYPVIVAIAAAALGRDRLDGRRVAALALTSGGLVLVVAAADAGALDVIGTALGVLTALVYSAYILVGERVAVRVPSRALAALVCTGAGVMTAVATAAIGDLRPAEVTAAGWGWLACLALISTVGAIALFFAGLSRVGPTTASILSSLEPLVTVVLVLAVFGDALAPVQVLGGLVMLCGVMVIHARPTRLAHATA